MYRDSGCSYVSNDQYASRTVIAAKMKSLGVNAVRMNYSQSYLSQADNLNKFMDVMQTLAAQSIYSMPSDHTYTGSALTNHRNAYPLMRSIVEQARTRGIEDLLILNPYNEPGPGPWADWVAANKDTLDFIRKDLKFTGVVVLDGVSWAAAFDAPSFQTLMGYDATLLGGKHNLVFSNHWYPNIDLANPKAANAASNTIPVVIGELGQENPGASSLNPGYVTAVVGDVISNGITRGHNGAFAWIWNWCDTNSMTDYGNSYVNL